MKVRGRVRRGKQAARRPQRFVTAVCLLNLTEPGRLTHFHIISGLINRAARVAVVGLSRAALFKFARAPGWTRNLANGLLNAMCVNTKPRSVDDSWLPIICSATSCFHQLIQPEPSPELCYLRELVISRRLPNSLTKDWAH